MAARYARPLLPAVGCSGRRAAVHLVARRRPRPVPVGLLSADDDDRPVVCLRRSVRAPRARGRHLFQHGRPGRQPQHLGRLVARYTARAIQDILVKTNGLAGADSFGEVFDENLLRLAHGTTPEVNFKLVAPATPEELARLQTAKRVPQIANFEYSTGQPELARQLSNMEAAPYFSANDVATGARLSQVAVTHLTTKPWIVAFFQPRDVFLAPVQQQSRTTLTLSLVMAIGVAALALLGAQVLATPLARLTATAEQVAAGDLSCGPRRTAPTRLACWPQPSTP